MTIEAGWDFDEIGSLGIFVTEQPSAATYLISVTTGTYCHTDLTTVLGTLNYDDLAAQLQGLLTAAQVNITTWTVVWNATTMAYTFTASGGAQTSVDLTFDASGGNTLGRQITGFSANQTGALTYASDVRPYYVASVRVGAASYGTGPREFEPAGIAEGAEADDGSQFAVSRTTAPSYRDFSITTETEAATRIRSAPDGTTPGDVPWTWQHLWQHARADEPLLIADGVESAVAFMRPSFATFKPRATFANFHDRFDMDFGVTIDGYL